MNELAARLKMDPIKLREMNITREGDIMPAYYGGLIQAARWTAAWSRYAR